MFEARQLCFSLVLTVRPYALLFPILSSVCFRLLFLQASLLCFSIHILEYGLTAHQRLTSVPIPNSWVTESVWLTLNLGPFSCGQGYRSYRLNMAIKVHFWLRRSFRKRSYG